MKRSDFRSSTDTIAGRRTCLEPRGRRANLAAIKRCLHLVLPIVLTLGCSVARADYYYAWVGWVALAIEAGSGQTKHFTYADTLQAVRAATYDGIAEWQFVQASADPTLVYSPFFPKAGFSDGNNPPHFGSDPDAVCTAS